ncbi:uncharacterized protein LOC129777581 [Toxorhynchites rutilus septentrionalis]|uniref:uncharacterized protein LOC129777581 n=1 Tax=Toxorhynchites rutilus septentrionalis TaxID=329112 RepID=UPI0024784ED8|nr:uncharacterized protein LOC129777581 [Toxorhynchites rutilus septentrionalis]
MLTSRKPGPPVPPRPSAAAVASALAKHRENSPSKPGMNTLKPAHPGRTVVYKSPAFDHAKKPQQNASNGFNGDSYHPAANGTGQPYKKTEVYVGESNGFGVDRSESVANLRNNNNRSSLENGKLMYTSTCSIIEVNSSSSSASTSASSSPVSTLQKSESKSSLYDIRNDRNHPNSAHNGDVISSKKQLKNTYNHRHLDVLGGSTIKCNLPDVIVINSPSQDHDSGTDQNSMDTNSIASNGSLERENNLKNLETRSAHLTEIIIGSGGDTLAPTTTVLTNGASTVIEARNDSLLANKSKQVTRNSSIHLPYRPEPEGGEHRLSPANDFNHVVNVIKPPASELPQPTIDSKLSSEKKVAFHELLISELTAMRSAVGDAASKCHPAERRSSPELEGTATRLARIRTSDWVEVGDNGKEVFLSSCQISLEDSGMEDEEKLDDASSGVGDSWDSVKDAEERITMSMPGLPPLPKSLSGFDLASQQLQSHQQHHHNPHHQQQQQQHQHQHHQAQQQQQQQQQHHHHHHQSSHHPSSYHHQQHQNLHPHQHLQPPQSSQQQQQPQQSTLTLNHHPTNPFIPIGSNLQSVSMASLVSQRGQSPVSSISSSNSTAATTNSGSSGSVRKPTTLDTQLAILRREMYGLRQLDLSLLSQLWALNESIQEFRTMLQDQETLSPPSPTPSNSDINSVSSDDDEDDSSNTQTVGGIIGIAAATVLSSSQSSRMRAPPPPPPNRKAPSRPV